MCPDQSKGAKPNQNKIKQTFKNNSSLPFLAFSWIPVAVAAADKGILSGPSEEV